MLLYTLAKYCLTHTEMQTKNKCFVGDGADLGAISQLRAPPRDAHGVCAVLNYGEAMFLADVIHAVYITHLRFITQLQLESRVASKYSCSRSWG